VLGLWSVSSWYVDRVWRHAINEAYDVYWLVTRVLIYRSLATFCRADGTTVYCCVDTVSIHCPRDTSHAHWTTAGWTIWTFELFIDGSCLVGRLTSQFRVTRRWPTEVFEKCIASYHMRPVTSYPLIVNVKPAALKDNNWNNAFYL